MIYDVKKLKMFNISPDVLTLLYIISNKETNMEDYIETFRLSPTILKGLKRRELVDENNNITKLGANLLDSMGNTAEIIAEEPKVQEEVISLSDFQEKKRKRFIDVDLEWLYHWREDYMSYRDDIGGSVSGCIAKMTRYLKENPEITPDIIIKATNGYINSLDNLKYMRKAHFFIEKDKSSTLEEWVENILEEGGGPNTIEGEDEFL